MRLAAAASPAALARRLRPTLEWLVRETGESAQLTVLDAGTLRVIDEVAAPSVLTVRWLGRLLPFDTSSVGKVLYAWRPPAELEALLARPLERPHASGRSPTPTSSAAPWTRRVARASAAPSASTTST